MRSGSLSFLLRLLLACSLVLGGAAPLAQAPAAVHAPMAAGSPAHAHCHDAVAGQALEHPAAGHGGTGASSTQHAHGCCTDMAACLGHCALAGALPVAVAGWPAQALPAATLPRPADAGHAPPAPRRLIRPPITA